MVPCITHTGTRIIFHACMCMHIEDDVLTELWSKKKFHYNSILMKDGIQRSHADSITLLHALPQIFPIPFLLKLHSLWLQRFLRSQTPRCAEMEATSSPNRSWSTPLQSPPLETPRPVIMASCCASSAPQSAPTILSQGLKKAKSWSRFFLCDEAPKDSTPTFCRGLGHTARTWRNEMESDNWHHCLKDQSISV